MDCMHCNQALPQGAKFCCFCGKPQEVRCASCGEQLAEGAHFCFLCGTPAGNAVAPASSSAPAPTPAVGPEFVIEDGVLVKYLGKAAHVDIPFGVKVIGKEVFFRGFDDSGKSNRFLTSVSMPDTVERIEETAFCNCVNLAQVELSEVLEYIGEWAFSGCKSLTTIGLPDSLQTIDMYAFSACSLTNIGFPGGKITLGREAFSHNPLQYLEYLNAEVIPDNCFDGCENLSDVDWHPDLKRIGTYAFHGTGFEMLMLPSSVEWVGKCAFCNCRSLERAYITAGGRVPKIHWEAFYGSPVAQNKKECLLGEYESFSDF